MPSVDNRVVQMRFDNKDFEEDIGTSIKSLDQLKKSLKLEDATSGFNEVEKAANSLTQKLSVLGTIGDQILRNFANELYSLKGKFTSLVKSLSIDQLNEGWDKYAQKTEAVRTIMSATADQFATEAEQMAEVNKQLDKLNWFTDETSYRLTDMTENIGKFTNQGMDLEKSVRAMQGIATWAGLSGANVNEASRAMYNLSQALGVGAVTLIDWKSIVNANMATKEFKEMAMEMAVTEKTLTKVRDGVYKTLSGTEVTLQNFNNTLSDRWFSDKVLMATLDKFGGFSEELSTVINKILDKGANITTSDYLKYLADFKKNSEIDLTDLAKRTHQSVEELRADLTLLSKAEYDLGYRAFVASQQAKTFQEAINATKDAVSSKWLRTFEIIFGTYDKARELWTGVSEELWDIFALGLSNHNEVLEEWASEARGGYAVLWRAIDDIWKGLKQLGARSWDIWHAIFPELTVNNLLHATYQLSTFAYKFKHQILDLVFTSEELEEKGKGAKDWVNDLAKVMGGFRSAIELLLHVLSELGKFVGIPALKSMLDVFKWGLSIIAPFSEKFTEFVNEVKKTKVISRSFTAISDWFKELKKNLAEQENFKIFIGYWQEFTTWLDNIKTEALNNITNFINDLGDMEIQLPTIKKISEFLNKIFGFLNKIIEFSKKLPGAWDSIRGFFENIDFSSLQDFSSSAASAVSTFFQSLFSDEELEGTGRRWIKSLWNGISNEAGEIDGQKLFGTIIKALEVGVGAKLGLALANFFSGISRFPLSALTVMDGVKDVLVSFAKTLRAAAFLQIAVGVLAIAAAMRILSKVPYEDLTNVAVSMALVLGVIALILNGVSGIVNGKSKIGEGNKVKTGKITGIRRLTVNFATLGPALIGFAAALGVILYGIKMLQSIKEPDRASALKTIGILTGIIAGITILLWLLVRFSKSTEKVGDELKSFKFGGKLLALSTSILIIAMALKSIISALVEVADLVKDTVDNPEVISVAIFTISSLLLAMGGMVRLASTNKVGYKSIGLIITLIGAFALLLIPLRKFVVEVAELDADWKILAITIGGIALLMVALGGAIALITKASSNAGKNNSGFMALLGIASILLAFAGAMYILQDVKWDAIKDSVGQLALFILAMTMLGFIVGSYDKISKGLTIVAAAILSVGAAIAMVGVGVWSFAKALEIISKLSGNFKDLGKNLGEGLRGFLESLNGIEDQILVFVGKIVLVIMSAIMAKKAKITDLGANLLLSFAEGLTKNKTILVATIMLLLLGILDELSTQDNLDALAERLISLLVGIVTAVSTAILNQAGAIWSAIKTLIDTIAWLAAYIVVEIYNSVLDLLPEDNPLVKFLKQDAQNVEEALEEYRQVILLQAKETTALRKLNDARIKFGEDSPEYEAALKEYEATMRDINKQREEFDEKLQERAEKRPTFIETLAQSFGNGLKWLSGFGFLKNDLNYISDTWTALKDHGMFSKEYWSTIFGNGNWMRYAFGPLGALMTGVKQLGKEQNDIWKPYNEYALRQAGGNVPKAVAKGITDETQETIDAIAFMSDADYVEYCRRNGMHSPSKVYYNLARNIPLGIANAIEDNSFVTADAIASMADDSVDSFSTVISTISDAIDGDFDLDPTIRPVLDLSEIQNGSSRLNSIWSGYQFSPDMRFGLDLARSVAAATAGASAGQTDLSDAVMLMQADIAAMKEDNAVIIGVMDRYMPYIPDIANMEVDLDSDTLVGKLTPKINKELGNIASHSRRGR